MDRFSWLIERQRTRALVFLSGFLDEQAALIADLAPHIDGPTCFDLEGIHRVTSRGVREWSKFMDTISALGPHQLRRCSPAFVAQLNMIPDMKRGTTVESVMAPYFCEHCDVECAIEIGVAEKCVTLPEENCSICGQPMLFDDVEQQFFDFLEDKT